jgi:hypothetical protein
VEEGFKVYIERKQYPPQKEVKTDGDFEAYLIAFSCSKALEGYSVEGKRMGNTAHGKQ